MNDIHVLFYGASGGHICAHLILQSGQHFCTYDHSFCQKDEFELQFKQIKTKNWDLMKTDQWRDHHSWPNNDLTYSTRVPNVNRLYFTCAPNECKDPHGIPDSYSLDHQDHKKYMPCTPLLVWTDIDTQAELARFKKSRWFLRNQFGIYRYWQTYGQFVDQWESLYKKYKQPQWPDLTVQDIPNLNEEMARYLLSFAEFRSFFKIAEIEPGWSVWKKSLRVNEYNGFCVERSVYLMLQENCLPIRLQDVAKTRGRALTDLLDLPWTENHGNLVDQWLALHPKELRAMLLD